MGTKAKALREHYAYDHTPFTPVNDEWDVAAFYESPDGVVMHESTIICHLEYPNALALRHARMTKTLGYHEGNVFMEFGDGQAYVAVFYHPNSPVNGDDVVGTTEYLRERTQPIPLEMAMRIHPAAFARLRSDVQSTMDYLTEKDKDASVGDLQWALDLTAHLSSTPTFGDGSPRPERY